MPKKVGDAARIDVLAGLDGQFAEADARIVRATMTEAAMPSTCGSGGLEVRPDHLVEADDDE